MTAATDDSGHHHWMTSRAPFGGARMLWCDRCDQWADPSDHALLESRCPNDAQGRISAIRAQVYPQSYPPGLVEETAAPNASAVAPPTLATLDTRLRHTQRLVATMQTSIGSMQQTIIGMQQAIMKLQQEIAVALTTEPAQQALAARVQKYDEAMDEIAKILAGQK